MLFRGTIMISGIYKIRNLVNNKIYVGSSKRVPYRINRHKKLLDTDNHDNPHLQSAWKLYGENKFEFSVIEECSPEILVEREQHYKDYYESLPGGVYNICDVVQFPPSMAGIPKSEEHRKKIGMSHKGEIKSSEHRKKISESVKKYFDTHPEARQRLRDLRLGTHMTEEQRRKVGIGHWTPEIREKIMKAKKRGSEHHNSKLSESQVRLIRKKYSPRTYSLSKLSKEFSVDRKTILRILQRKTWTHI
jgi:group I intron endonuclease